MKKDITVKHLIEAKQEMEQKLLTLLQKEFDLFYESTGYRISGVNVNTVGNSRVGERFPEYYLCGVQLDVDVKGVTH